MAQKTWSASDILTASDMNTYASREGGAFTTWVPAVVQLGSVTVTVNEATYARAGRLIHFTTQLTVTGSGTGSNDITISLPVTAKAGYTTNSTFGGGLIRDVSITTTYHAIVSFATTTTVKLKDIGSVNTAFLGGATASMTAGLASTDFISIYGFYEAAA